jgi:hypothetical protein
MTGVKKVTQAQFLRSEAKLQPFTFILGDSGGNLQVDAGETVNVGAKPDVDETVDGRALKWIFVEATTGQQVDKRKGFVLDEFLGPEDTDVPASDGFVPFSTQVNREDFANTCYLQAALNGTNPAYLYALAFALSGDQWSDNVVKTDDPAGALAFGIYRFTKDAWQKLILQPEAEGILPDDIKFPDVQCIMAAIVAAKSAPLLKGKITGRGLSAVDLTLALLFNDTAGSGSDAATTVLQAAQTDGTQSAETVIEAVYPDLSVRTVFFKRNASIFREDGSATIGQALEACANKLAEGFDQASQMADEADSDVFGDSIPEKADDPIPGGSSTGSTNGSTGSTNGAGHGGSTVASVANGIDRRQFLGELNNPALVKKSADMVKGEVGWGAPHNTKLVQLETAFNRAMARGHSLAQALLSTSEDRRRGYYQGGANGTYSRPVTSAEFDDFKKTLLQELLAGSNKSEELLGFIATGNASPPTSTKQFASGMRGGNLPTALPNHPESYFDEPPHTHLFKRFQSVESVTVPGGPSSSGPSDPSLHGEPPEHMDGDTEGSGPSGGKFNVKAGTPLSPQSDRITVTFTNGQTVVVNKAVAEQFRGFFNDLIKLQAPVRGVFGFGMRANPSEHPIGFATDWMQTKRNEVSADVQRWIDNHRDALKKLERRWGLSGGENWHNPDTGHFSIERIFGDQHLQAAKAASARDVPPSRVRRSGR